MRRTCTNERSLRSLRDRPVFAQRLPYEQPTVTPAVPYSLRDSAVPPTKSTHFRLSVTLKSYRAVTRKSVARKPTLGRMAYVVTKWGPSDSATLY